MSTRLSARKQMVMVVLLGLGSACGSSDSGQDSGQPPGGKDALNRDTATLPEVKADAAADTVDAWAGVPDVGAASEASRLDLAAQDVPAIDLAAQNPDALQPRLDLAPASVEVRAMDGPAAEAPVPTMDSISPDGSTAEDSARDSGGNSDTAETTATEPDVPTSGAETPFDPGPATPVVVNSGNTALYSLADGTWKIFYFDTEAGQMYVVSGLDGITRGYLGTSPSVSPTSYLMATDPDSGTLLLTATTSQRYYLAVGVKGGGASGSFQVADGGKPIALGTTTLSLTPADAGAAYYVYRFPVTTGRGYALTLQGPPQPNIGMSVAPRPERTSIGELSYSIWGVGGSLPFTDEKIPASSVANSTSGYYFIELRILAPITFTIAINEMQ